MFKTQRNRARRRMPWTAVAVLTTLGLASAPQAAAAGPDLAFASNRDGDYEIYVMNADGSGVGRITDNPAADLYPVWSPDGRRIAFASDRDGDFEVYVMNGEGSDVRQLTFTDASGVDRRPAWSPDGREVLFDRPAEPATGRHVDLYAVNVATGAVRRLTNGGGISSGGGEGDWSPRQTIVLQRHTDTVDWEIGHLDPATGAVTQLTSNSSDDLTPAWFPDGSQIAFSSRRSGTLDIWKMASNGAGPVRLTTQAANEVGPQVSCDGSHIAYIGDQAGNNEIYVMRADGSSQTRLTSDAAVDTGPGWRCLRNTPPALVDDAAETNEDTALEVPPPGVLANDADREGDSFTIELAEASVHGETTLRADGSFTYVPKPDFHGADSFRYRATDIYGATATTTVVITVNQVNDDPVANADTTFTEQYTPVSIDVLANDTDIDGDVLSIAAVSAPSHGEASIADGKVTYAPGPTFKESDSFSYTVADGHGGTDEGTIAVTAIACGEDGLETLQGTPLGGLLSGTIDREVEPALAAVDAGLARAVHEVNCEIVVPAEDATGSP